MKKCCSIILMIVLLVVQCNVYADFKEFKADIINECPNISAEYRENLALSRLSLAELKVVNAQIVEYKLNQNEQAAYIEMLLNDKFFYLLKAKNMYLSPFGVLAQNIDAKSVKNGDVIGYFQRVDSEIVLSKGNIFDRDIAVNRIPLYKLSPNLYAENNSYICVEDLEQCGFEKHWDEKKRISSFTYTGKTFTGKSEFRQKAGLVYKSDVKIIVNGKEIPSFNLGGYSLIPLDNNELTYHWMYNDRKKIYGLEAMFSSVYDRAEGANTEDVSLPNFKVTVNDKVWNNQYNRYPILVYKDISYFPMTYDNARFLGLKTAWYPKTQPDTSVFFVGYANQRVDTLEQSKFMENKPNPREMKAQIAWYDVAVNTVDKKEFIKNQSLKYPLLSFKGITYFPLTWYFVVEKFGCEYSYDGENGLVIKSGNTKHQVLDETILAQ